MCGICLQPDVTLFASCTKSFDSFPTVRILSKSENSLQKNQS